MLFSRISRNYIPTPKANFVKLVINGESWGVYVNVQQVNKDFLREWFGTGEGVRWKVPAGRSGAGGLAYRGPDPVAYKGSFELNSEDNPEAWQDLVGLCAVLSNSPADRLEAELGEVFDIHGALWFLALENVFIDGDGYVSRGSDYHLYQDPQSRFHLIAHDNNENFRYAGGGGPNRWPSNDPMLSPVGHQDNPALPVISRLLAVAHLRARYLAHVRTLAEKWLDWGVLAPIIEEYRSLIGGEVAKDDKKLYSYDAFVGSLSEENDNQGAAGRADYGRFAPPSLRTFTVQRREYLLSHPEIRRSAPRIQWVRRQEAPVAGSPVRVEAQLGPGSKADRLLLYYYAAGGDPTFSSLSMFDDGSHGDVKAGDGVYAGEIPGYPAGTTVRYYLEARAVESLGTTAFVPESAARGASSYRIAFPGAESSPVLINELLAVNGKTLSDPQGEYDDWLELHNTSDREVDLSGKYLSDKRDNPRKWIFPPGTTIAPRGYLIVWADEDGGDRPGLHANFKLSGGGEQLLLVDTDRWGNRVLDAIEFGEQQRDISFGRSPDGGAGLRTLYPSPGASNGM